MKRINRLGEYNYYESVIYSYDTKLRQSALYIQLSLLQKLLLGVHYIM